MKKIIIYSLIFLIVMVLGFFLFPYEIKQDKMIVTYTLSQDGKNIFLYNQVGDLILNYSLDNFKNWAKNNWKQIFPQTPAFGEIRKVEIDNFNNFSNLSMSNSKKYLAFVVSDYAVLTDISFIGLIDLKTQEISLVNNEVIGSPRDIIWSTDDYYIAYLIDTARNQGEYLRVDDILSLEKLRKIETIDISANDSEIFSYLVWEDNNRLIFSGTFENKWQFDINNNELFK